MRKVISILLVLLPLVSFGQGKVTRQESNNTSTQSTSTTQNATHRPSSSTSKRSTTTPIKITLATEINGQRKYFSPTEWKNIPTAERIKYNKIGMVIKSGKEEFLMSLYNNMESGSCVSTATTFSVAYNKTNGILPTKGQLRIIHSNHNAISSASRDFGGDHICSYRFWCNDGTPVDLSSSGSQESNKGMFRMATSDVQNGFQVCEYRPETIIGIDYVSESSKELKVARHKDKYSLLNSDNKIVVPFKYDAIGCNDKWFEHKNGNDDMSIENYYDWISVSLNGKWGCIDRQGREIVPIIYDAVQDYVYEDDYQLCWVQKEGRYGALNKKGELIISLDYESEIRFFNHQPTRVKKDDKWGFINEEGVVVIPIKYTSTRGFSWDGGLAPVSVGSKHGYIDTKGNVIIPLKYDFADSFSSKLAGVVLNNKVGYINESGVQVIPCVYDVEFSSDGDGTKLGFGMSFQGRVAMVKKNGKYGMINRNGENVTSFKYDRLSSSGSSGWFTAHVGNQTFYLDKGGNEYSSEEERLAKSDSILAYQGYPYEQFKMGKPYYKVKEYEKAYPWFKKSADGGDDDGQCHLGYYYYYGYAPINKSDYNTAFSWFSKAAEVENTDACYFLGWMYEHGQGVPVNKFKALEWYKKSKGERDSEERIAKLSSR